MMTNMKIIKIITYLTLFSLLLAQLCLFSLTHAQAPDNFGWVQHNTGIPPGGDIVGSAIDPTNTDIIYVATRTNGVYKSTDAGASWTQKNTGVNWWEANSKWGHINGDLLVMDPNNPLILYTAFNGKIYKTVNGADSWTLKSTGTTVTGGEAIAGIAIDPTDSNHLYAGTIIDNSTGGVFETINGGTNWTLIAGNGPSGPVGGYDQNDGWPLALDPVDPDNIYLSALHGENYLTYDGGVNWLPFTINEYSGTNSSAQSIEVHPTNQKVFVAFSNTTENVYGVWVSSDFGANWSEIPIFTSSIQGDMVQNIKFSPSDSDIAFAVTKNGKIYKSSDGGANWTKTYDNSRYFWYNIAIDPLDPDTVYFGSYGDSFFKSTDAGVTVLASSSGISILPYLSTFAQSRSNPEIVYIVAMNRGIYRSTNYGYTWEYRSDLGTNTSTYAIAVDPENPNILLAPFVDATDGLTKIHRSTDGGLSWTATLNTVNLYWRKIIFAPSDNNIVYAVNLGGLTQSNNVLRSNDNGQTWSAITYFDNKKIGSGAANTGIDIDPLDENNVFVAGDSPTVLYKSTDGGANWSIMSNGITAPLTFTRGININPYDPDMIFISNGNRMFRSVNGGELFAEVLNVSTVSGCTNASTVTFDVSDPNIAYLSAYGCAFKSTDMGETWTEFPTTDMANSSFVVTSFSQSSELLAINKTSSAFYLYENNIPAFSASTLSISNDNGSSVFMPGDIITVNLTVVNTGPATANNLLIDMTLPSGVSFISGSAENDSVFISPDPIIGNKASFSKTSLNSLESSVFSFKVRIEYSALLIDGGLNFQTTIYSDEDVSGTGLTITNIKISELTRIPELSVLPITGKKN